MLISETSITLCIPKFGNSSKDSYNISRAGTGGSYLTDIKAEFSKAAGTRFGSGWAWLCVNKEGKLCVCSTPNQDNSLM